MTSLPALLATHLQVAVPLEISRMRRWPTARLREVAADAAQEVAERGDSIQYRTGHTAAAMAALTRGLAALALTAWGGVTYAGMHWCQTPGCANPRDLNTHPQPTT